MSFQWYYDLLWGVGTYEFSVQFIAGYSISPGFQYSYKSRADEVYSDFDVLPTSGGDLIDDELVGILFFRFKSPNLFTVK